MSFAIDYSMKIKDLLLILSSLFLAIVNIRIGWHLESIRKKNSEELEKIKTDYTQQTEILKASLKKIEIRIQGIHSEKLSIALSIYKRVSSMLVTLEEVMTPENKNSVVIMNAFSFLLEEQIEIKNMLSTHEALLSVDFRQAISNLIYFSESVSIDHGHTLSPDSKYREYLSFWENKWIKKFYPIEIELKDKLNEIFKRDFDPE